MNAVLRAGRAIMELIYPSRANCLGCGSVRGVSKEWLCNRCRSELKPLYGEFVSECCARCGTPTEKGANCRICDAWTSSLIIARAVYAYEPPASQLVARFKYSGVQNIGRYMALEMAKMIDRERMPRADLLVPVPAYPLRMRTRGYNQAEVLARALSPRVAIPVACALRRVKHTRQQAKLSRADRIRNMKDAFVCGGNVRGKAILLVDDVRTTGATASACADALMAAGASRVYLTTFCASVRVKNT